MGKIDLVGSLFCLFFCGFDARYKDCYEFVALSNNFGQPTGLAHWFALDYPKPDKGLSEFFQADLHLVHKIATRFRTLRFAIIRRW